jgi:hypothetical protein
MTEWWRNIERVVVDRIQRSGKERHIGVTLARVIHAEAVSVGNVNASTWLKKCNQCDKGERVAHWVAMGFGNMPRNKLRNSKRKHKL